MSTIRSTNISSPEPAQSWQDSFRPKHREQTRAGHCTGDHLVNTLSPRYYQPNPDAADSPYPTNSTLKDPEYSTCLSGNCDALGLRVLDSENILIYGAGLYSFFNNYSTDCSTFPTPENCQSEIFSVEGSTSDLTVYTLSTVGTTNMIVKDGTSLAVVSDNLDTYAATIAYFTL